MYRINIVGKGVEFVALSSDDSMDELTESLIEKYESEDLEFDDLVDAEDQLCKVAHVHGADLSNVKIVYGKVDTEESASLYDEHQFVIGPDDHAILATNYVEDAQFLFKGENLEEGLFNGYIVKANEFNENNLIFFVQSIEELCDNVPEVILGCFYGTANDLKNLLKEKEKAAHDDEKTTLKNFVEQLEDNFSEGYEKSDFKELLESLCSDLREVFEISESVDDCRWFIEYLGVLSCESTGDDSTDTYSSEVELENL